MKQHITIATLCCAVVALTVVAQAQVWFTTGVETKLEELYTADELFTVAVNNEDQSPVPTPTPLTDHWELSIFRTLVSTTTPFTTTTVLPTACGRLKRERMQDNTPNPVEFAWDDPSDPTKDCVVAATPLVIPLPLGVGYLARARACTVTNVCGAWVDASALFRRAPRGVPCANGLGVEIVGEADINGKPVRVTFCIQ